MNSGTIKVWMLAARPRTLWAAAAPVVIGSAMAFESGAFHFASAWAALLGALLIQVGTNLANDYFDYQKGTDGSDRLGPTRVTQAGLISPEAVKRAAIAVFGLAVIIGSYLVWRGGWPILVVGVFSIISGILYTAGPAPLAYIGLGDIFVLVFFGPVAVGGTYYVQTLQWDYISILAGFAPGLFSVAILTVNNLRDIESDRKAGRKTLAVRFGRAFSQLEYIISIIVASGIPLLISLASGKHPYSWLTVLTLVPSIPAFIIVLRGEGQVLNELLAATGRLLLLFSLIFSVAWLL